MQLRFLKYFPTKILDNKETRKPNYEHDKLITQNGITLIYPDNKSGKVNILFYKTINNFPTSIFKPNNKEVKTFFRRTKSQGLSIFVSIRKANTNSA